MHHATRGWGLPAVALAALLLSACGAGGTPKLQPLPKQPFAYDASRPLLPRVAGVSPHAGMNVTTLTYVTFDGTRVPALLAVPRGHRVSACLMFQPGVGAPKEAASEIWPGAARLGVAVFTIDPRFTGSRARHGVSSYQIRSNLRRFADYFRANVIDLRRGLDYFEERAMCHHDVGYMGISQGAAFGVMLAGSDTRIRTAVLCSMGATFRDRTFYSPEGLTGFANDPPKFRDALAELAPLNQMRWIGKISPRPVMLVEGLADPFVTPAAALELSAAAREPKVVLLHPGGHNPFAPPDGRAVAAQIAVFLNKTLIHRGLVG